jgi:hypothetical protein
MLLISSPECNHKNISRKSTLGVDIAELGKWSFDRSPSDLPSKCISPTSRPPPRRRQEEWKSRHHPSSTQFGGTTDPNALPIESEGSDFVHPQLRLRPPKHHGERRSTAASRQAQLVCSSDRFLPAWRQTTLGENYKKTYI